jgi:dsDNA-specific endonuclease/ATPase MutS2
MDHFWGEGFNNNCSFLIVHGNGYGILRSRIRGFLSKTDLIDGFKPGETANAPGGSGVTIART